MNKLMKATKYTLYYSLLYTLIFYGIFIGLDLFFSIMDFLINGNFEMPEVSVFQSSVFLAILATLKLNSDFKLLIQNGYNRLYIFLSSIIRNIILCLLTPIFEIILIKTIFNDRSLNALLSFYKTNNLFLIIFYVFAINMLFCSISTILTRIFSLVGMKLRIVLIILSTYLLMMIIGGISYVFNDKFIAFVKFIIGQQNPNSPNILIPTAIFLSISILLNAISYLFVRRMQIK